MTEKSRKRGGLGRGMDALFTPYEETPADHELVEEIYLDEIRPNPYQPRKHFDQEALEELAESIKQNGVFQPIIVRQSVIKGYELIAGERRVRASRLAGQQTIPAIVRQMDEEQMIEIAVVENLQREDLSPLEEAEAYRLLMDKLDLTQAEVADRIGKSRPYIANYLRLLSLPDEVKDLINEEKLSMGQARTLLGLKNKDQIVSLAEQVVREELTVRQLEDLVNQLNQASPSEKATKKIKQDTKPAYIVELESQMEAHLGTQTRINKRSNSEKGKIEIEFYSSEDLTRILDILGIQL